MGQTLTQCSHKRSHKSRRPVARLTRKRGVYFYRRRLPAHLGTDLALSLGTRLYRYAEHLAERLDSAFDQSVVVVSSSSELRDILRAHLEQGLAEDAERRFSAPPRRPIYGPLSRMDEGRSATDVDCELLVSLASEARDNLAIRDYRTVEKAATRLLENAGLPPELLKEACFGLLEMRAQLLEEMLRRSSGQSPVVLGDSPASEGASPKAPGELFSVALPRYIDFAVKDKGWRGQSKAQNETTFEMFQQVCGDLSVRTYTRAHLSDFYEVLRGLPALYSKDRRWRDLPLREAVELSKDDPAERLTVKTRARHFAALGGFFTYAKRHGLFEGENPAHGFDFPKRGRANAGRQPWQGAQLIKLFESPAWTGCHPVFRSRPGPTVIKDDKYWLPLLGLFHGNRLEEFAQLRREDVKQKDGIWYLDIHGEGGRQIKNWPAPLNRCRCES